MALNLEPVYKEIFEKFKTRKKFSIRSVEKNVLIVEDIIDTGQTINFLYDYILKKSPKDIKIVSFLFKPDVYKLNINIDWVGFSIDNNFVVGYGLDYDEKFRGLDSIYKLVREKWKRKIIKIK